MMFFRRAFRQLTDSEYGPHLQSDPQPALANESSSTFEKYVILSLVLNVTSEVQKNGDGSCPFSPYDSICIAEFLAFESAQVAAFEVRDRTILFGVVTDQFELEVGDVSEALHFDESKVQPYKWIVRAGLINTWKMTDTCRASSTKWRRWTSDARDESRTLFDKKLSSPGFKCGERARRELIKSWLASALPVDSECIPYVDVPTHQSDTLIGMSLLMCMQHA